MDNVLALLLAREDLLESIQAACDALGFTLNDLNKKSPDDFGDKATPSVIKMLRYRNYETKRMKRLLRLLAELKARRLLFYYGEEIQASSETKLLAMKPATLPVHKTANDERRRQTYENAAVNVIMLAKRRIQSLKQKAQRHASTLVRLRAEDSRRRVTPQARLKPELLPQLEKVSLTPQLPIKKRFVSVTPKRPADNSSAEEELEKIQKRLAERSAKGFVVRQGIAEAASRMNHHTADLHKAKLEYEAKFAMKSMQANQALSLSIDSHQSTRQERIEQRIEQLRNTHAEKKDRLKKFNHALQRELLQKQQFVEEKQKELEERLKKRQEEKRLEHLVCSEKRNLKKQNQIDKVKEQEAAHRQHREQLVKRLFSPVRSPSPPKDRPNLFQDSVVATKLNTARIIAKLRLTAL